MTGRPGYDPSAQDVLLGTAQALGLSPRQRREALDVMADRETMLDPTPDPDDRTPA